jgi:hypothetical protein
MTDDERMQRESSLIATIRKKFPVRESVRG